ncbi:PREDICTED: nucleolin 2 [Camelina sativa]|uniref:Nucleolin 2 n=1 Tax=Camelina sativa TaxID=90675 RepID=A0ABM0VZL0_CAMSA|nr:PREDICTED: nucleolin 2 [Camelina sativa]
MEGSTVKGFEFIDSSDASDIPRQRGISSICVEGFDTSLYACEVELALTKHFSSCGKVTYVNVRRNYAKGTLHRHTYINIYGEGALEKALQLSGKKVVGAGWRVFAKEALMTVCAGDPHHTAESIKHVRSERTLVVEGYDTSLPEIDLQIGLTKYFSSCGEVNRVTVPAWKAFVSIRGEGAVEKALELSGRDVGGWNITVVRVLPPLLAKKNFPTSSRSHPSNKIRPPVYLNLGAPIAKRNQKTKEESSLSWE